MNVLSANGVELAFDSFGDEGDETVLLISGLGTQMIRWTDRFCERIAEVGYRVVRFDNRDAGYSTHFAHCGTPDFGALATALMAGKMPDVPYSLYDMANDAVALLDGLSVDRAHVVGRSMGGMIAQIMASEHPERVLSITSIMSSTGNPLLPQAEPDVMSMMTQPAPDPIGDEAGFLAHSVAFARRCAGSGYVFEEEVYRALVLEEVRRCYDPGSVGRQIAAIATAGDRRSRLATINVPSLILHGMDDPLIPPACGRDTASSIPGARLMLIEGMGHDIPSAFYEVVIEAIDQTARGQSGS